jgi:hypothetical protein
MTNVKTIFGLFLNTQSAKTAIAYLQKENYNPQEIPLIVRDRQRVTRTDTLFVTDTSDTSNETEVITGISVGAAVGGIIGFLLAFGSISIPGVDTIAARLNVSYTLASTTMSIIIGGTLGGLIGISLYNKSHNSSQAQEKIDTGIRLVAIPTRLGERQEVEDILTRFNVTAIQTFRISTRTSLISDEDRDTNEQDEYDQHIANPVQVQQYLKHVDYPMTKEQLIHEAEIEGADQKVINTLEKLPKKQFTSPISVSESIGSLNLTNI